MNEVPVSLSRLGKIFWAYNWRIAVYLVGFIIVGAIVFIRALCPFKPNPNLAKCCKSLFFVDG